jgi:4-hydroxybenzoate polyprenyltransferase
MEKILKKIIEYLESTPLSLKSWVLSFGAILAVRIFLESLTFDLTSKSSEYFLIILVHTLLFFLLNYVIFLIYLKLFLKESLKKIANILLWGYWIIIFPPLIDKIIFGDSLFWSFYLFNGVSELFKNFFLFFGENPQVGITYGSRIGTLFSLVFLGVYFYYKKRKIWKTALGVLGAYLIFFLLSSFPSLITYVIEFFKGNNIFLIFSADVAKTFISPFRFFGFKVGEAEAFLSFRLSLFYCPLLFLSLVFLQKILSKEKLKALVRNIRYPQMFFNFGIFFIGIGLGWFYFSDNFKLDLFSVLVITNLMIAIFSAWFYSVFVNDLNDRVIDKRTNQERPLIKEVFSTKEYRDYSLVFLFFALIASLLIGAKFFLLIVVYLFFTWIYSAYPFRFKRFPVVAGIVSALASLIFLFMGFVLIADQQELSSFPWRIFVLLFIAYFFVIPLKDLKDIEGDREDGVITLPTLFGVKKSRFILGSLVLASYFFSVYIINETRLFLPALVFGGLSFWVITNDKVSCRKINWWILGLASIYGIILVKIIFF